MMTADIDDYGINHFSPARISTLVRALHTPWGHAVPAPPLLDPAAVTLGDITGPVQLHDAVRHRLAGQVSASTGWRRQDAHVSDGSPRNGRLVSAAGMTIGPVAQLGSDILSDALENLLLKVPPTTLECSITAAAET